MTVTETLSPIAIPLREDKDGVVRVAGTRVTLDTVVAEYWNGLTAEEISSFYDVLSPADVHAVLVYYLRNRAVADEYLAKREAEAERVRARIEADSSGREFKEILLARQARRRS